MSNLEASKLYEAIVEEVISDSRQDFEDSGIDESTLDELKAIWCDKLTQSNVAKFSWDRDQQNHYDIDPQIPQNTELTNGIIGDHTSQVEEAKGLEFPNVPQDSRLTYNTDNYNNGIQILDMEPKQEYDDNGTGLMLPRVNQMDGTFELSVYSDNGKDIMKSLKEGKKLGQNDGVDDDEEEDDDIFNEADDINSELDDGSESEKSEEEEGDQEGQIMLCLYDKVQRVKNKWKCNLREGVANINGRDYVFQKATGESEW